MKLVCACAAYIQREKRDIGSVGRGDIVIALAALLAVGISRPSGYAAAAGLPLVICVAEQGLFGRGLCVGGVSPVVSVCGLYMYAT